MANIVGQDVLPDTGATMPVPVAPTIVPVANVQDLSSHTGRANVMIPEIGVRFVSLTSVKLTTQSKPGHLLYVTPITPMLHPQLSNVAGITKYWVGGMDFLVCPVSIFLQGGKVLIGYLPPDENPYDYEGDRTSMTMYDYQIFDVKAVSPIEITTGDVRPILYHTNDIKIPNFDPEVGMSESELPQFLNSSGIAGWLVIQVYEALITTAGGVSEIDIFIQTRPSRNFTFNYLAPPRKSFAPPRNEFEQWEESLRITAMQEHSGYNAPGLIEGIRIIGKKESQFPDLGLAGALNSKGNYTAPELTCHWKKIELSGVLDQPKRDPVVLQLKADNPSAWATARPQDMEKNPSKWYTEIGSNTMITWDDKPDEDFWIQVSNNEAQYKGMKWSFQWEGEHLTYKTSLQGTTTSVDYIAPIALSSQGLIVTTGNATPKITMVPPKKRIQTAIPESQIVFQHRAFGPLSSIVSAQTHAISNMFKVGLFEYIQKTRQVAIFSMVDLVLNESLGLLKVYPSGIITTNAIQDSISFVSSGYEFRFVEYGQPNQPVARGIGTNVASLASRLR